MATPVRRRARARGDSAAAAALALLVTLAAVVAVVNWVHGRRGTAVAVLAAAVVGGAALTVPQVRRAAQRRRAAARQAGLRDERSRDVDRYHTLNPEEFEEAIAYLCERDGCRSVRRVVASGDFGDLGADVIATAPDGRRVVVQCRRFGPAAKVGAQDVRRFGTTCFSVQDAEVAAVVTTSVFTGQAVEYATREGILLFDRDDLAAWATGTGPAPWE